MSAPEYTHEERSKIVRYLVDNKIFTGLKGNAVWQEMEEAQVVNRSWQSMRTQFRNRILDVLHQFDISEEDRLNILHGAGHRVLEGSIPVSSEETATCPADVQHCDEGSTCEGTTTSTATQVADLATAGDGLQLCAVGQCGFGVRVDGAAHVFVPATDGDVARLLQDHVLPDANVHPVSTDMMAALRSVNEIGRRLQHGLTSVVNRYLQERHFDTVGMSTTLETVKVLLEKNSCALQAAGNQPRADSDVSPVANSALDLATGNPHQGDEQRATESPQPAVAEARTNAGDEPLSKEFCSACSHNSE